jgi:hypothetical protein
VAGTKGQFNKQRVAQVSLPGFNRLPPLRTVVISRRQDFDNLFEGFTKLRAISYVISPDLLLEFFDNRGYTEMEVLVGENLAESYQQGLEQKSIEVAERLAERVEDGTLRIYIPDRTIHTKLYVLEGSNSGRVIVSSANLTEAAHEASRQINYAWYADLPADSPLLAQVNHDYQLHLKRCALFMDNLKELLNKRRDMERRQLIEAWLRGGPPEEEDPEVRRVLHEISFSALKSPDLRAEPVIRIRLPEAQVARRHIEKFLAPLRPSMTQNELHLNGLAFVRYVEENHRFPLMRVDLERQQMWLGINGTVLPMAEPLPDAGQVNDALQHIESYVNTVDLGQAPDPVFAKTSMFEALLYMLAAPFANEHMKDRWSRFGGFAQRGPRFLYIYGPAQNGKSTFLRFALKLLTGRAVQPLSGSDFTKARLSTATSLGTVFPLVFDDVVPSRRYGLFEEVVKSYWEIWWKENYISPQIIVSSNNSRLKEWAKSRVKRVDFDVQFAPSERSRERLAQLFATETQLFRWFSYLYLSHLESKEFSGDDELELARTVMTELYAHAQRSLPQFFPRQPIEALYDPGRQAWRDVLKRGQAKTTDERDRILVKFTPDMQPWEIHEYQDYLPQTVKYKRQGNTLIIQSRAEFRKWLESDRPHRHSLIVRLLKR